MKILALMVCLCAPLIAASEMSSTDTRQKVINRAEVIGKGKVVAKYIECFVGQKMVTKDHYEKLQELYRKESAKITQQFGVITPASTTEQSEGVRLAWKKWKNSEAGKAYSSCSKIVLLTIENEETLKGRPLPAVYRLSYQKQGSCPHVSCDTSVGSEVAVLFPQAIEKFPVMLEMKNYQLGGVKTLKQIEGTHTPQPDTHQVNIQPILVAKSDGTEVVNAKKNFVKASTQKIMQQAGIKVNWLEAKVYKNDEMWQGLFDGDHDVEAEIGKSPANMKDKSIIYAIFVKNISTKRKVGGMGLEGGNIFFIAEWALARKVEHVVAHELCHNLGLGHENFGSNKAGNRKLGKNVMYGVEPYSINDVYPDGQLLSQINAAQKAQMLKHPASHLIKKKAKASK